MVRDLRVILEDTVPSLSEADLHSAVLSALASLIHVSLTSCPPPLPHSHIGFSRLLLFHRTLPRAIEPRWR